MRALKGHRAEPTGHGGYPGQQQALNNALLRTLAAVTAELESKLRTRAHLQHVSKLNESRICIAILVPKLIFKQKLRAFATLKQRLGID